MSEMSVIRAMQAAPELRDDEESEGRTLFGHFAVFDTPTEINSAFEGNFIESIAPGAFRKTFKERGSRVRPLFQHGHDPMLGDKPIGRIDELHEDDRGAYFEVGLYDGMPDLVMAGLRDGAYGSSFRFQSIREDWVEEPEASEMNPRALPERTIKELRLFEFGPVTFPAYADATAAVRSLTDHFVFEWIERHPDEVRSLLAIHLPPPDEGNAPDPPEAGNPPTSDEPRRASRDYLSREEERPAWELP